MPGGRSNRSPNDVRCGKRTCLPEVFFGASGSQTADAKDLRPKSATIAAMKLLLTIVQDADASRLQKVLIQNGFDSTKLASTGGFLREGNTTLLIGVETEQLDRVRALIEDTCRERTKMMKPNVAISDLQEVYAAEPMEVTIGGAVVFVVDVESFWRL